VGEGETDDVFVLSSVGAAKGAEVNVALFKGEFLV
jgi:hypothetical protein